ncbi:ABC transporter permease [Propionimicrobium sp. PCR01-08-3]|uniref:ABC transporter permease n=1 Tax=Propionimicrobium sp. PCR01-08-3 TaxID=3052086 RepID=UPI00255CA0C1|nr:ABC transporter permease [Propionimicrobium sp. PCR01-08-3]WIY84109.1 ABC transporter permease [Propionimicrobium sp. PCR01-08-3]
MIDTIISGLVHGNVYALVAVGISLIFGVTNVVNFAQGSIVGLGAMLGWWFMGVLGWPWWVSLAAVALVASIIGYLINISAVRPLLSAPPIAALLATFAASMILDNLSQIVFGSETRAFPEPLATGNLRLGGVSLGTSDLVSFGFTIVAMTGLWAYLKLGRNGRAIRATAADPDAAAQMGVPVARVQNLSFLLASLLGGIGGIFYGMFAGVISPISASFTGTVGFIAAAVGGLGSITGAVVGGLLLGLLEALGVYAFGDGFRDLFIFGLFIIVLLVRPHGLLGAKHTVTQEPMTGTFLGAGRTIELRWWHWLIVAALAAVAVPVFGGPVASAVGTQVIIYAIMAVPMTLLAGSAGQVSLGQAAPVAIGAYASALLVMRIGLPFGVSLLLAGVIAAVIATVVTLPIWRLGGHYISLATLALGYVVLAVIRNWDSVTQGAYGLTGIPAPQLFDIVFLTSQQRYLLDLALLAITLAVVIAIRTSHLGTVLSSVGSDEVAARSLGIFTRDYKIMAYAITAFFAGIAGSLLAHQYNYLDPTVFPIQMSILVLTIVVLGGMNAPFGAVIGAIVLVGLPEALRIASDVRILLYGVIMIAMIRFRPQGLWTRKAA